MHNPASSPPRFAHVALPVLLLVLSGCAERPSDADPVASENVREYTVSHTTAPLTIDGRLDEPAWQTAPFTEDFVLYADGQTPQKSTKAQMLWDNTFLYIAFSLEDRDVWATMSNHDDRLWEEEAAEVFIDPDGDGLDYVELQVNALGTKLDLLMSKAYSEGGSGDFEWNLDGFTAGVVVNGSPDPGSEDGGWTVEMALPFAGVQAVAPSMNVPPQPGDTWRINLCRMEAEFGDRSTLEASAWNQTDSLGFHMPERFGLIVFGAE